MFFSILASIPYPDEESFKDGRAYIKKNSHSIWKLANHIAWYMQSLLSRPVKKVAVAIDYPNFEKFFHIEISKIEKHGEIRKDDKYISNFARVAKESLDVSPFEVDKIAIAFWIDDDEFINNDDWMYLSRAAGVDIEAPVLHGSNGALVMQGYSEGDYDTGFFSNEENQEDYAQNEDNEFFFSLQNEIEVNNRLSLV